jgi:hypothetical protein
MGRLLGDLGAAHPLQGHLSQERRDASPSFRRQHVPNLRRQIAHRGIQANGPKRIALQTRFSVIRCVPSIYERYCEWDIELAFMRLKSLLRIDCLPAKTDKGGRSWIYAHLILAIATGACSQDFLDSSP